MKLDPRTWSFRGRFFLGFLACFGLLAYALYVEHVQRLMPCAYCIYQRIAFIVAGIFFLLGAIHGPRPGGMRKVYGLLSASSLLVGAGIAARHVWVQLYPPPGVGCGAGLDFLNRTRGYFGALRHVLTATGDCSTVDWKFLGLSMPAWTLVCFIVLAVWALWSAWKTERRYFA